MHSHTYMPALHRPPCSHSLVRAHARKQLVAVLLLLLRLLLALHPQVLRIHTRRMPLAADVDLPALAADTTRFTGAGDRHDPPPSPPSPPPLPLGTRL